MLFQEAQDRLGRFLKPLSLSAFLDETLQGPWARLPGDDPDARTGLLGPDPAALLSGAHQLAPHLTWHSANPAGPAPGFDGVTGPRDFRRRIEAFHAARYSLRFPRLRALAPEMDQLARALEAVLLRPVTVSAFWSRPDMRAPVHSDDHDLIVVQLRGRKRWYLANRPSPLKNTWDLAPDPSADLGDHSLVELAPGDAIHVQRGTVHTVDADEESLHLAIGFTPLTVRELVAAALDHLSDHDRAFRRHIGQRLGFQLRGAPMGPLGEVADHALAHLARAVSSPGFLTGALERTSARSLAVMEPLPAEPVPELDASTRLVQAPGAWCRVVHTREHLEVAYPGGRLYIHPGAEAAVRFIAATPNFQVRDIPGEIGDEVRLSLAARFCGVGFLRTA